MKNKLPPDLYNKVVDFCHKVHEARSGRDLHNNDNDERRIKNEIVGKCGEAGVAHLLKQVDLLDFTIYANGKVDFSPDLGNNLHVKTCHMKFKGQQPDSWTVDRKDPICTNPDKNDLIALVYANERGDYEVYGTVYATALVGHWKNCLSEKLRHKVAVYRVDVDHLIKKL